MEQKSAQDLTRSRTKTNASLVTLGSQRIWQDSQDHHAMIRPGRNEQKIQCRPLSHLG